MEVWPPVGGGVVLLVVGGAPVYRVVSAPAQTSAQSEVAVTEASAGAHTHGAEADAGSEAECPRGWGPVLAVVLGLAELEVVVPVAGQGVGSDPMPAQPSRGPGPYGPELDTQAEAEVATLDAVVRGEAEAGRGQPP